MLRLGLNLIGILALAIFVIVLLVIWLIGALEPSLGRTGATAIVLVPLAALMAWLVWRVVRAVRALRNQYAGLMARFGASGLPFAVGRGRQYNIGSLIRLYLMWRFRRFRFW